MQYAAHYNQQKREVQTVQEHCLETAKLAAGYGKRIGAEHLAKLTGLLHDIGKFTEQFNEYVRGSERYHRGEIDHSYAGAKYICEKCGEMGAEYYEVSRFIARLIVSHHGLHDWIDFTGNDYLNIRIQKKILYTEPKHFKLNQSPLNSRRIIWRHGIRGTAVKKLAQAAKIVMYTEEMRSSTKTAVL